MLVLSLQEVVIPVRRQWRSRVHVAAPAWWCPVDGSGAPNPPDVKRAAGKHLDPTCPNPSHCSLPPVLPPPTTVLHLFYPLTQLSSTCPNPTTTDSTHVPSVSRLGAPPPAITPSERATGATLGLALPAGSCAYCSCPTVATPAPSPAMTWSWSAPNR